MAVRLVRVVATFLKEAAQENGLERIMSALIALEAGVEGAAAPADQPKGKVPPPPVSAAALPLRPPGR